MMRRRAALIAAVTNGGLPREYQEVEWIGSSGTQYINTGVIPKASPAITIQNFTPISTGDLDYGFMQNAANGCLLFNINGGTDYVRFGTSSGGGTTKTWLNGNSSSTQGSKFLAMQNGIWEFAQTMKINGEAIVSYSGGDFSANTQPVLLVRGRNNPSTHWGGTAITVSGGLQWYGIPCYRKSDGEIGMYDLVNGVFYTNAGTGTFTKGADV